MTTATASLLKQRIQSIDLLRGIIMIIMALDHTRDYFHSQAILEDPTNLATTTPGLFFTRWITHFCAPVFLFLAGTAAFISGQRKTTRQLSVFLITRGLWIVLFELVFMTLIMSFNPQYNLMILTVLWAIGWSMVLLGLLVHTGYTGILIAACILFFGHNIFDLVESTKGGNGPFLLQLLATARGVFIPLTQNHVLIIGYAVLPWTAIMLLGYLAGKLYSEGFDAARRKKILLIAGLSFILLFIVLRLINQYGDPSPWSRQPTGLYSFLSFLNTTKYPVSLQYSCMTLGPALMALALLENQRGKLSNFILVYGKVPLFYFAGHFLLIHLLETIVFFATNHTLAQAADPQSPFLFRPANFGYGLGITYLVWIMVVLLMYYPCKWFGRYKQTHSYWWLSYL